ncbi:MAG: hypothetical protein GY716_07215 [bacterium]|nr:hypothetical protein [bacterium]
MRRTLRCTFAVLPLLLASGAAAESSLPSSATASVPFEVVNNHILVPVSVNGSDPFRLILDTGMPAMGAAVFDSKRVRGLKLPMASAMQAAVGGAGGNGKRLTASVLMGQTLGIGDLVIQGAQLVVIPEIDELGEYHQGVIGRELFAKYVVELNYDEKKLTLHDRKKFQAPAGATELPVTFKKFVPYATASATMLDGTVVPLEIVVDIGASHALSLNFDSDDRIRVPEGAVETALGRGVSGEVLGHVGRVKSFTLAGRQFDNLVVSFPESDHQNPRGVKSLDGNLGNGILSRFNIIFDYTNRRLLLLPNPSIDDPFEFDMSGIQFRGDSFEIKRLVPGSVAAEVGLQPGDVVLEVDGRPAETVGFWTLREMLREHGRQVVLEVERGSRRVTAKLRLRRFV